MTVFLSNSSIVQTLKLIFWFSICLISLVSLQAKAQQKTHTIKSGETLSSIAKKYKTTIAEIQKLNPDSKRGIQAGSELILPGGIAQIQPKLESGTISLPEKGAAKTHEVKQGESLFKIAKLYHVSVKELEEWNQIKNSELKVGQEILFSKQGKLEPKKQEEFKPDSKQTASKEPSNETQIHSVEKGQTLSTIARLYGTKVIEIKRLNQLKSDNVNLGQELIVPRKTEEIVAKVEVPKPTVQESIKQELGETKPKETLEPTKKELAPDLKKADPVESQIPLKEEAKMTNGIREVSNTLGYTRVVETGFAEAIEGDGGSKKHLCLHKSAPIGSILQVKNEMNGQSVFVKVIGKLPDTGSNEKLIIRLSRQAYDRLLAVGKRFPVEVSYPQTQP